MKNRILIIEDNYYKYFTTKQVLESQLRLGIEVIGAETEEEAQTKINEIDPHSIISRPKGGVADLLNIMLKRNVNRRNTEITLLITPEASQVVAA
jgi:hypothetical protein